MAYSLLNGCPIFLDKTNSNGKFNLSAILNPIGTPPRGIVTITASLLSL
jgi:hypothetical protein